MATASWNRTEVRTVTVEEYLKSSYRPDCDYLDGVIEERNVGEFDHSQLQTQIAFLFALKRAEWALTVLVECRLQVAARRFRIPDVMVIAASQKVDRIVREAPLLCIEVLSPEDTWAKMRARLNDYLAMGVEHVWCFDPEAREARRYTADGFSVVSEAALTVPGTAIELTIADVFSVLEAKQA
jgi:Uma2 family endonuclease